MVARPVGLAQAGSPVKGALYTSATLDLSFRVSSDGKRVTGFKYLYVATCLNVPFQIRFGKTAEIERGKFKVNSLPGGSGGPSAFVTVRFTSKGHASGAVRATVPCGSIQGHHTVVHHHEIAFDASTAKPSKPTEAPAPENLPCADIELGTLPATNNPNHRLYANDITASGVSCTIARAAIEAGALAGEPTSETFATPNWTCTTTAAAAAYADFSCSEPSPPATFTFGASGRP